MLRVLGVLMFVLWLVDNATQRPAGSLIHFSSSMACIAFVAEFVRSRVVTFQQSRAEKELASAVKKAPSSLRSKAEPIQQV